MATVTALGDISTAETRCYLLELPAELRNTLCELVLLEHHAIDVNLDFRSGKFPEVQPPVTRVCRQIRSECLPVFYAVNAFSFLVPMLDSSVKLAAPVEAAFDLIAPYSTYLKRFKVSIPCFIDYDPLFLEVTLIDGLGTTTLRTAIQSGDAAETCNTCLCKDQNVSEGQKMIVA